MELAKSVIAGKLVSRFISFLINKYSSQVCLERKMERLKHLLLRVHTVVEEADERYITNSGMLVQLKMLEEAMYRGYHVLDIFKYKHLKEDIRQEVSALSVLPFASPLKRFCTTTKREGVNHELQSALENLEDVVANMTEFVILLGGCERMSRRPYDTYLYIDNFMFGRRSEKQQIINILLQYNHLGVPTVLPIIGGYGIGKKTLVAHVCNDQRVRSHFSSILHFDGTNFWRVEHERYMMGRTLVVIVFDSDVDDEDWAMFYSLATQMDRGSKVIIISRLEKLVRFGTVKPIRLNMLSSEEFSFLFKTLAFGSANPEDHPQLVSIASEIAVDRGGSLVTTNALADMLRKNMNVQFWLCILKRCRTVLEKNISMFGEHPKLAFERGHSIDITNLACSTVPLRVTPCLHSTRSIARRELPTVTIGDLMTDPNIQLKGEFNLVSWESRIPPYTIFINFATTFVEDGSKTSFTSRKRPGLFV